MNYNRLRRNKYKRAEFFAFQWFYNYDQILEYPQSRVEYIALRRFHKNLKRHSKPNSYFMKVME